MKVVQLQGRILGYSLSSTRKGEEVQILVKGMTSTENGDLHIKCLEGLPQDILSMMDENIMPVDIKNMIVLISHDLKAKVYINETEIISNAYGKAKKVEKGQTVTKDDIYGIERTKLGDISFPDDHAYFCVLSFGWDKAYIFDFTPLDNRKKKKKKIEYDVEEFIGSKLSYLLFKKIHTISDSDWEEILKQNWFPFSSLKYSTIESIINYAESGSNIDDLIETIEKEILIYFEDFIPTWKENEKLNPIVGFLESVIERHNAEDYVSSISIMYPQIESLIRQDFIKDHSDKKRQNQSALVEHITEKTMNSLSSFSIYIPHRFKKYLEEVYFKDFTASSQDNQISRNSVAHGASSIDKYGKKESLLGLLIFSQIMQYIQEIFRKLIQSTAL